MGVPFAILMADASDIHADLDVRAAVAAKLQADLQATAALLAEAAADIQASAEAEIISANSGCDAKCIQGVVVDHSTTFCGQIGVVVETLGEGERIPISPFCGNLPTPEGLHLGRVHSPLMGWRWTDGGGLLSRPATATAYGAGAGSSDSRQVWEHQLPK